MEVEEAKALLKSEQESRLQRAQEKLQALLNEEKVQLQAIQLFVNGQAQPMEFRLVLIP